METDRLITDDNRTYPNYVFEMHFVITFFRFSRCLLHCGPRHLNMGNSGQDLPALDDMIRQEKLLAREGRTEPLLAEIRGILMQHGVKIPVSIACPLAPGPLPLYIKEPIAFPGKRIGGQADATRPCIAVELVPINNQTLDPEVQGLRIFSAFHPFVDGFLKFFIRGEDCQGLFISFDLPVIEVFDVFLAFYKTPELLL